MTRSAGGIIVAAALALSQPGRHELSVRRDGKVTATVLQNADLLPPTP
jgi:hypothetical protein